MRMELSYETKILHPLAPFYPADIESLRFNQTHSASNVRPYYTAGEIRCSQSVWAWPARLFNRV
jgi:hypothetical protein